MHFDLNLAHLSIDPASVVVAWVSVCAAVSLVNKYVVTPYFPLAARIIGLPLNILPAHVGQLITDIEAIIADIKSGGSGPGTTPTATAPATPAPATPPPPASGRVGLAMLGCVGLFAFQTAAFGAAVVDCTPAERAEASTLEDLVLHDLQAGDSDAQIENDIASQLAGQPGVDAVIILNDVLQFLIDAKAIPADLMSAALTMKSNVAPTAAAHRIK
jgi:hypothetical protein